MLGQRWAHGILAGLVASVLAGCGATAPATTTPAVQPVVIGVSGPLTGPRAQYGAQWKKGFDLAVAEINAAGGVKGRPLEYVFEDSQADPKQSVVVAQKFIADERIVVELGDFASTASMAASPIYQRAGMVQFGFTNSHPDFTKGGDFMWSISISQLDNAPRLAGFAIKDLGFKRLAVMHLNTDYGRTTFDLFSQAVTDAGGEVIAQQAYLPDDKDFRAALTDIKGKNPDAIVLISYYNDAALITQQARQQGITTPIIGDAGTVSPEFLKLAGPAAEGYLTTSEFFPSDPAPEVQAFVKAYHAKYNNEDPDLFSAIAYDAVKIIAAVMQQYGTERAQIKDGLGKIKDVPSVMYGKVTFRDDRRVANPKLIRLVVKDGKYTVWEK